jgi:thiol-disulfide isomerase/thioredoxin
MLKNTDGKMYTPKNFSHAKVLVIIFTCNHCPYAQAVEKRLLEFHKKYAEKNVQLVCINANDAENYPDDSFENMQKKKYPFPYLYDETQTVAHTFQAQCTPDIYAYYEQKLAYHGRFDDNWQDQNAVTSHNLEEAVKALLADKKPSADQKPSMGCSIKWKIV